MQLSLVNYNPYIPVHAVADELKGKDYTEDCIGISHKAFISPISLFTSVLRDSSHGNSGTMRKKRGNSFLMRELKFGIVEGRKPREAD